MHESHCKRLLAFIVVMILYSVNNYAFFLYCFVKFSLISLKINGSCSIFTHDMKTIKFQLINILYSLVFRSLQLSKKLSEALNILPNI